MAAESVLSLYKKLDSWLSSDPIIHEVRMRRRLHEGDGVEDVVNVVAEVEDWISYDRLGWGDASRQQRQSCGQRQRRLQLLHCEFLQSPKKMGRFVFYHKRDSFTLIQKKHICIHASVSVYVYLLALLQKEQKLHAYRRHSSTLGSVQAAVGQKHPQQGLVLPQPRLAPLRVLLLGLKTTSLHLVALVGAGLDTLQGFI